MLFMAFLAFISILTAVSFFDQHGLSDLHGKCNVGTVCSGSWMITKFAVKLDEEF